MTTRIYKNEFDEAYIKYLKDNYTVESETEKVLTLGNITEEDEDNFHKAMFKSYDELCDLFPGTFTTFEEEVVAFMRMFQEVYYDRILKAQCEMHRKPCWNNAHKSPAFVDYKNISSLIEILYNLTKSE